MKGEEQKRQLALEALRLARFDLLKKLPVLGAAVAVPVLQWTEGRSGTDAKMLYWNVEEVLAWFMEIGRHV